MRFTYTLSLLALAVASCNASAKTELVVYSDVETEMLSKYGKAFQQQHPDIRIKWVRDSAGPIAARLLAEKEAPKADVVFGLTLNSLLPLASYGLFESYQPAELTYVSSLMKDNGEHPLWIGLNGWTSNLCINKKMLEAKGLPMPATWQDLTKPEYKGHIVMPSPVSSGTGYMALTTWLQTMGDDSGWQYVNDLNDNMKMYTHSGCKPCQMAAQGEIAIGISAGICAASYSSRAPHLAITAPTDGVGWEIEAIALVKGTPHKEAAQKLIDFAVSEKASKIAVADGYIPNRFEFSSDALKETQKQLITIDIEKSTKEKEQTLAVWSKRFDHRE
jgi:iron(III) transport system substrate-binding protein